MWVRDCSKWFATELWLRLGNYTQLGEDPQLAYLLPWLAWPAGSQGMPTGILGQDKAIMGREVWKATSV